MGCRCCNQPRVYCSCGRSNNYGCMHFLLDTFMTIMTGGFWLIWIFVREMRKRYS